MSFSAGHQYLPSGSPTPAASTSNVPSKAASPLLVAAQQFSGASPRSLPTQRTLCLWPTGPWKHIALG